MGIGSQAEQQASSRRAFLLAAFALAVALAALAGVTALARRTFERLQHGSDAREHAYDVLITLRRIRQDIGEMRVGVTGYVISHDSVYLATYRSGTTGLAADTTAIRRLTADVPSLQRELDRLQPELRAYDTDLASTLRTARLEGPPVSAGSKNIPSLSGVLIETLRPRFVAIEAEQTRLLELSTLEVERAVYRTNVIFTWVLLGGTVVVFGTAVLLFVHLRARARAEAQLARAQEQLNESQRLEAVGQLAGGVAHDFNNILTVITGFCELVQAKLPVGHPSRRDLLAIREAGQKGAELTRQLLAFSRRQVLELSVLDLNGVVERFRGMLDRVLPANIEVVLRLADDLGRVRADRVQMEQILMNLGVNARDAMSAGGRLTMETANAALDASIGDLPSDLKPGRYVALIVSDTGIGMDEATRARIFEPFFTTKATGKGSGLGLATVYGIVKQSGGQVWVYSEPGRGSTFKIYLPRVEDAPGQEPAPAVAATKDPRGTETILLVEDEERVREVTQRILAAAGYRVLSAARPEAALEMVSQRTGPIQLLLTDVVMPGMSGPQLAAQVVRLLPGIKVLYQSGYSEEAIAQHGALESGAALLSKPFTGSSLQRTVRAVLDGTEPPR